MFSFSGRKIRTKCASSNSPSRFFHAPYSQFFSSLFFILLFCIHIYRCLKSSFGIKWCVNQFVYQSIKNWIMSQSMARIMSRIFWNSAWLKYGFLNHSLERKMELLHLTWKIITACDWGQSSKPHCYYSKGECAGVEDGGSLNINYGEVS